MSTTLTEEEYDLLVFLEQYWWLNSALPSKEKIRELGLDEHVLTTALRKDVFKSALVDRGVDPRVLPAREEDSKTNSFSFNSWKNYALTEEQLAAANIMLDLRDNRSQRKKLMELGIPTQKWEAWLRDPIFQSYLRQRAENLLGDNQHEAHLALIDRVRAGELPAIKYFNELTGRYVPVSASQAAVGSFDVKLVLIRVVEILQIHLGDDPVRLQAIASDLISLAEASGAGLGNSSLSPSLSKQPVASPAVNRGSFNSTALEPKSIEGAL